MKCKHIEFICSGNLCRSIVAEAIAKKYLADNKLSGVCVSSSGALVDTLDSLYKNGSTILDSIPNFINELYNQDKIGKYQRIMINRIFEYIRRKMKPEKLLSDLEHNIKASTYRVQNFLVKNGVKQFKRLREQTVISDVDVILTMSEDNIKQIKKIYDDSPCSPQILLLPEFCDDPVHEFRDPLMVEEAEFYAICDKIKEATRNFMKQNTESE